MSDPTKTSGTGELTAAQRHLHAVIDNVPAMIGYWDKNLRNRFGNQAYASWFGVQPVQLPGKHIRAVIGEINYHLNLPYITQALHGLYQQFERAIPTPDGARIRYSLTQYIPDIVTGDVQGFYAIVTDISDIKKADLSRLESEQQMRIAAIAFETQQGMFVTSASKVILQVNRSFTEITGYTAEEAIGQTPLLLKSGHHDPAFYAAMWDAINRTGSCLLYTSDAADE